MPQIILKERTAQLVSYTSFTRDVDQYQNTSTTIKPFSQKLATSYFRPLNIAKSLRTAQNTSRSSRLQMFFTLKSFANFKRKHLCWSLFLKNLQAEGLQLYLKRLQYRYFPVKFAKFLRTPFLQNTSGECFCTSVGCFCIF